MSTSDKSLSLWQRYLLWRKAEGVAPPKAPERTIKKLAIDDGDVASAATANRA